MDPSFLSIIIPVYNAKEELPLALGSIISQTYKDYEIIVIDGLSTDGTVDLIKKYADNNKNIRYRSEADSGIYDAMNKGIEMARGQWLYFLGSDDVLYDKPILSSIADEIAKTSSKVIYGNVEIVGNTSWAKNGEIYDGPFNLKKLLIKNICHQSIFYNTEFIKNEVGGYNTNYKLCADWDFNLRCYAKSGFTYADIIVAKFYGGGLTTASDQDEEFSRDFVNNIIKYFKISLFNPVVNSPLFRRYNEVLELQRKTNYLKYILNRLKVKFF